MTRGAVAALALALLALSGCTDLQEPPVTAPGTPAPVAQTVAQVRQRVPTLLQQAVDAFSPAAADVQLATALEDSCDEQASPDPAAPVRLTRSAFLTAPGDAAARVARAAGLLVEQRGWRREDQAGRTLLAADDGYGVVLTVSSPERIVVTGVSPCASP